MANIDKNMLELLLDEQDKEQGISLADLMKVVREYWDFLWSKKWIVVACGVLFGALGLAYAWTKKLNYTATYVFSIEGGGGSSNSSFGSIAGLLGLGGSSMGAFSGDNLVELIKAKSLVERTLLRPVDIDGERMTLIEYKILTDSLRSECDEFVKDEESNLVSLCELSFPVDLKRDSFSREQDSVLSMFSAGMMENSIVVAKRDKKLSFVEFSVTSSDERFSKLFAENLLSEVTNFYVESKTELVKKNIASFQYRADSVRRDLDKALFNRAAYADGNVNASRQVVGVQLQKANTDIQILGTVYAEMIKNIEMLNLDLARETPLIRVVDAPYYPLANDKMGKKKGLIVGGFLGGFLSVIALCAWKYILDMKRKMESEEVAVVSDSE